jgi:hypothetical protein
MNEKIKELAKQANIYFSRVGILDGDPNGSARMVGYSKMEKFAELIVQECARVAKITEPDAGDEYASGRTWAGIDVLKHFGVEE